MFGCQFGRSFGHDPCLTSQLFDVLTFHPSCVESDNRKPEIAALCAHYAISELLQLRIGKFGTFDLALAIPNYRFLPTYKSSKQCVAVTVGDSDTTEKRNVRLIAPGKCARFVDVDFQAAFRSVCTFSAFFDLTSEPYRKSKTPQKWTAELIYHQLTTFTIRAAGAIHAWFR